MRLRYFGVCIDDAKTQKKHLVDVRPLLEAYCNNLNNKKKSQFKRNDEHLFLLRGQGDVYLFIMTRTQDIIQKINTNSLSVQDINKLLAKDENIGFASYVLVKESYIGFASSLLSPNYGVFADFVNKLLEHARVPGRYQFSMEALMKQSTTQEALSMGYIGKTVIKVPTDDSFGKKIIGSITGDPTDYQDVDSLEITIKPRPRKNIKKLASKLINGKVVDKAKELVVKAKKDELRGQSQDLYLEGQGILADNIDKDDRQNSIYFQVSDAANNNSDLGQKVQEFTNDKGNGNKSIGDLLPRSNRLAWVRGL